MSPRRIAVLCAAAAVAVVVVAAVLSAEEVALAALAAAMLAILGWLVLWARSVSGSIARLERALSDRSGSTPAPAPDRRLADRVDRVLRRQAELAKELAAVRNAVHRNPGLTAEIVRAYDRLVDHPHPMPELGGYALSPSTLLWILDHLASTPTRTVLECGSGTSTIWIATALERRGGEGHVVALESSDHYAAVTRAELDRLGLGHRATVVHAPLVETRLPGRPPQPWYDVARLALADPVDLLFVDGPPGNVADEARYPAFPLLADRLAPGATVVLDDTGRPDEDRVLERWCAETHHRRRLRAVRTVDRSTVLLAEES